MRATTPQNAFLLTNEVKAVRPREALSLKERAASEWFHQLRWGPSNGAPICPRCESQSVAGGAYHTCRSCSRNFTVLSGTGFTRALKFKTILGGVSFRLWEPLNGVQLSKALGIAHITACRINNRLRIFQGNVEAVKTRDNRWPYQNDNTTLANGLMLRVSRAVPKSLPEQVRADVSQDLILGVLSGEIAEDQLAEHVRQYIGKHYSKVERNRFRDLSLDQPVPGTDDRSWADMLSADDYQERLGWAR